MHRGTIPRYALYHFMKRKEAGFRFGLLHLTSLFLHPLRMQALAHTNCKNPNIPTTKQSPPKPCSPNPNLGARHSKCWNSGLRSDFPLVDSSKAISYTHKGIPRIAPSASAQRTSSRAATSDPLQCTFYLSCTLQPVLITQTDCRLSST